MKHKIQKTFLTFLLTTALIACGDDNDEKPSGAGIVASAATALSLNDVMLNDKCLSIPRYAEALRTLNEQGVAALQVTTDFSIPSSFRSDFRGLAAYGAFQFERVSPDQISEFEGFQQTDCETLSFTAGDGDFEIFTITEASQDFLSAKSESGRQVEYRWLTPHSLQVKNRYEIYDAPCTSKKGFVEYTKVLDWSSAADPETIGIDSELAINRDFLKLVTDAVGFSLESLYSGPGEDALLVSRLREMAAEPVRSEFLSCNGTPDPGSPDNDEEHDPGEERNPPSPEDPAPTDPTEPPPAGT